MVWRGVSAYRGPAISTGENSETWGHGSRFGILDIGGGKFTRARSIQQRSLWMGAVGQWQSGALVAGRRVVTRLLPAAWFEWNLRRAYAYEA